MTAGVNPGEKGFGSAIKSREEKGEGKGDEKKKCTYKNVDKRG